MTKEEREVMRMALVALTIFREWELGQDYNSNRDTVLVRAFKAEEAIEKCLANDAVDSEPVAWKLVPVEPTKEMLKAMDECSTEGYDERLYAGHAASVYMAAVDVSPTPPQRTWVGLTDEDWNRSKHNYDFQQGVDWAEARLKEKNAQN